MANEFVSEFQAGLNFAFGLSEKFLAICPDDVWQKKYGGWPVSQQFYHAVQVANFFAASLGGDAITDPCPEAGDLSKKEGPQVNKAQAGEFLANVKTMVSKMTASLQDADLLKKNEKASQLLGRPTSNAAVLELMATHTLYHLGSCDAALREQGLEGAF